MTGALPDSVPLRSSIAEEIRALLGRRKMTKLELSRRMGKSNAYVWRRLDGAVAFDVDDLEKIATILGVTVLDLIPAKDTARYLLTRSASGVARSRSSNRPTGDRRPVVLRPPVAA